MRSGVDYEHIGANSLRMLDNLRQTGRRNSHDAWLFGCSGVFPLRRRCLGIKIQQHSVVAGGNEGGRQVYCERGLAYAPLLAYQRNRADGALPFWC